MSTSTLYRSKKDADGDRLKVVASSCFGGELYFSTQEDGAILDVKGVKALRKALKKWLTDEGHVKPRVTQAVQVAVMFDSNDIMEDMPLAVVIEDEEGRIHEVVWERRT